MGTSTSFITFTIARKVWTPQTSDGQGAWTAKASNVQRFLGHVALMLARRSMA
ncbi:hypothetical protein [Nitrosomonas ureae]|uniref:hypothetical protein n=1 Tax=Nitrosomonas ureae TaxID=44577 RepID=UPI001C3ECD9C|nr:hypothetical protein [Nitrosomonas ureae]